MSAHADFTRVAEAFETSAIVRLLERGTEIIAAAARTSRLFTRGRHIAKAATSLSLEERVRLTGIFLATFAAMHAGLAMVIPAPSAPATPLAVWVIMALFGAGVAASAPVVAVAWERRQLFRDHTKTL